ncbi:hypothetical protein D3C78_791020 [compost metagenome]
MHPAPGHRQLRRLNLERRILSPQPTPLDQRTGRIIRHGGDHLRPRQQRPQPTELRHAKHHATTAPDLRQIQIDIAAQVTGKRHHRMGPFAVLIQGQRPRPGITAQHFAGNIAQLLALGIGRQIRGVAHAHRDLPRRQQRRHQQVIGPPHDHDDARCFLLQLTQQRRKQTELGIVRQPDAEHIATGRRIELLGPADRAGNGIHGRLQFLENRQRPRRRFHAATVAQQQGVVEQIPQTPQRGAHRRLAHEQFFRDAGQVLFEHQRLENHQQVHVDATQIVTVHKHGSLVCSARREVEKCV